MITIEWKGKIGYGDIISPLCYAHNISQMNCQDVTLHVHWMHKRGEKYKEEDTNIKLKIESKNNLESLIYQCKETITNEEIKKKITDEELKTIDNIINDTDNWLLDEHSKGDYDNKLSEINNILNPIMMKIYQGDQTEMPMPTSVPENVNPTIDEID